MKLKQSVPQFLKERLPKDAYQRLEAASRGWAVPLFAYDKEQGRYECALKPEMAGDETDPDDVDDDLLDAILNACELLSEADAELAWDAGTLEAGDSSGEMDLVYRFDLDESHVYERFRRLLEENITGDAGIDAEFQKYPWGYQVRAILRYQSDFDYKRKKDTVDWLLQVAKSRASDSPFMGRRL